MSDGQRSFEAKQPTDAATDWFERLRHGELSDGEMLAWLKWYEESESNSRAFDELQDFWRLSQGLTDDQGECVDRMELPRWWSRCAWRVEDWLARLAEERAARPAHRLLNWSAGVALAAAALLVLGLSFRNLMTTTRPTMLTSEARPVRSITLPDLSKVELAPNTSLAVNYSPEERRLEMGAGEANFVVAANKDRPFVVHLDRLRVRAVGTQFDIHRAADRTVVTVIQGKIDVYRDVVPGAPAAGPDQRAAGGGIVRVNAGEQFIDWQGAASVKAVDAQQWLGWREGRLRYADAPMADVIADLNRYVAQPVVIGDDSLKSLRYTGTVFTHLIDEWLTAIPKEFPLVVVTEADRTVLLSRSPEPSQRL